MPETSWNRIRPDTPLPQATVNYIGEGWHNPDHNDRADPRNHGPLTNPAGMLPAAETPPPAPPPTEAELRRSLHGAIVRAHEAAALFSEAAAVHQRSQQHVASLRFQLNGYADLDDTIAEHVTEQLRQGGTALLTDTHKALRQERDDLAAALAGAEKAETTLRAEYETACAHAAQAQRSVTSIACELLSRTAAAAIVAEHADLLRRIARAKLQLSAFDQFISHRRVMVPPAVLDVLQGFFQPLDTGTWQSRLGALLADPDAEIAELPIPEPPRVAIMAPTHTPPEEERLRILAETNTERRSRGDPAAPPMPGARMMTPIRRDP